MELGYLNEHSLTDDFADRPLPYRVFLNSAFNDDGVEVSYVLPTNFYSEIGGGFFRGDDYPFGGSSGGGFDAWSAFARIGGDIGDNQSWRLAATPCPAMRAGAPGNGDAVNFSGDSNLYAADLRYTWAPTGNPRAQEVILQGEYFWHSEDGAYEDFGVGTGAAPFDDNAGGWYAQAVYKFLPQWRIGYRYSRLKSPDVPLGLLGSALDSGGYNSRTPMPEWRTGRTASSAGCGFNIIMRSWRGGRRMTSILLQYIMSIGAHGAHKY